MRPAQHRTITLHTTKNSLTKQIENCNHKNRLQENFFSAPALLKSSAAARPAKITAKPKSIAAKSLCLQRKPLFLL